MDDLISRTADWLKAVLRDIPATMRAVYVEFDASAQATPHRATFHAYGSETGIGSPFDGGNPEHRAAVRRFAWKAGQSCVFENVAPPEAGWLVVLRNASETHEIVALATARGLQLLVGESDGEVTVIH